MLAIPGRRALRVAAPLLIVPIPILGNIVRTTTLPGGVVPGAGAGAGTDLRGPGLKGGGSQQIGMGQAIVSPTPMALPAFPRS
jgi:hypothetical protein